MFTSLNTHTHAHIYIHIYVCITQGEVVEIFEAEEVEVPGTVSVLAGKEKAVVVLVPVLELPVTEEVTSDIIVPV